MERISARLSQMRRLLVDKISDVQSPKRRRSYPAGDHRVQVTKRKGALDDDPQSQDVKRRQSYTVSTRQLLPSKRKAWSYDLSVGQSAQRRRFSLLRYHQAMSPRRSEAIDCDVRGRVQAKRKPSVTLIEDESAARNKKRKLSVIIIDDDDDLASGSSKPREYIFVDDVPLQRGRPKTPGSPKARKGYPQEMLYCAYCPGSFETMALKQEHLALEHPEAFARLRARCWHCSFRFRSILDLSKHVETAHVEAAHAEPKIPDDEERKQGVRINCYVCDKEVSKTNLRVHVKNKHPRAWNQEFSIEKMQKRYCGVCECLISANQRSLRAHIRNIHPELWKNNLTVHEMLAPATSKGTNNMKWAACPVCDQRYDADRLEKHMGLKHGGRHEAAGEEAA